MKLACSIALALLASASQLAAQPSPAASSVVPARPTDEQALAGFDAAVNRMLADYQIPGVAVAIVRDGRVVLARGYGVRNPDTRAAMTADSIFPIASMSKAFTSFSVGLLVDEGRMSLDAPVTTYIPDLRVADPIATQGLTLRDMLSHRSGMPRHDAVWYHNDALTREQLARRMPHLPFTEPMRTRFQYNNIMFVLSGLAVDRVAGQTWERFVEQRIFTPLGMRRTGFSPERALADPDHADGRELLNGRRSSVTMFSNRPILNPAGGIYSTASDLARWMRVHLSGGELDGRRIIQPTTLAETHGLTMAIPATVRDPELLPGGYGLGWFVNTYRGQPMVSHGGNLPGSSTKVALLPLEGLGVVVLVNHGSSGLRDALAHAVLDRFLGASGKDWVAEDLTRTRASEQAEVAARGNRAAARVAGARLPRPLSAYVGVYDHPGYGPITITQVGTGLVARYNDDSSPLDHAHYEVFDAATIDSSNALLDVRLQFATDFYGRVSGLNAVIESQLPAAAFQRQPEARLFDPAFLQRLTGTYVLAGNRVVVAQIGNQLSWTVVGGTPAQLLPSIGGEFTHSRRRDARIVFTLPGSGQATGVRLIDSSGVYEAPRAQ